MTNPWLERGFLLYAHQGGALEAPAGTLFAMEQAIGNGANAIELDVHCTKDGVLVVGHDPVVDTTTNGSGAIADLDYEYINSLDNAYHFIEGKGALIPPASNSGYIDPKSYIYRGLAPNDHRFGVALLEEVLSSFPDVVLNLDIKQTAPTVAPYEDLLAKVLRAHNRVPNTIVASFHDQAIARFIEVAPEFNTAPGAGETALYGKAFFSGQALPESITRHAALQIPAKVGNLAVATKSFVETAHELGLAVHVWTINEENDASHLIDIQVDAIMTDRPKALARLESIKPLLG